jgi:hypothetical protein
MIGVHRSYVPFWLLGVVGADPRPDCLCKGGAFKVGIIPLSMLRMRAALWRM